MKKTGMSSFILVIVLILASCATRPPAIPPQPPPPVIQPSSPPPVHIPEAVVTDRAVLLVKTNSPEIRKFFIQDDNREIFIRGEILGADGEVEYEISYEFLETSPPDIHSQNRISIGFALEDKKTGTVTRDSFYWPVPVSNAGVLLSFDDNFEDIWETWLDTLEAYDARATFFVHNFSPFAEKALARGHDIGYHSKQHLDLRNVSRDVFIEETIYDPYEFRMGRPTAFAYPYGFWAEWMNEELLRRYSVLRGYGVRYRLYNFDAISDSFIISTALDNTLYRDDAEFEKILTHMLRTAKFLGSVLPVTSHDISDTAAWGIKTYRLLFLLETARKLNLNFYRYRDF